MIINTWSTLQALVCFEKKLSISLDIPIMQQRHEITISSYQQLARIHSQLSNYEQAIVCIEKEV